MLDDRERYIVEQRLMADRDEQRSLADIGRRCRVSRERARQLEQRAMHKLKAAILRSAGGADFRASGRAAERFVGGTAPCDVRRQGRPRTRGGWGLMVTRPALARPSLRRRGFAIGRRGPMPGILSVRHAGRFRVLAHLRVSRSTFAKTPNLPRGRALRFWRWKEPLFAFFGLRALNQHLGLLLNRCHHPNPSPIDRLDHSRALMSACAVFLATPHAAVVW
jgi:Sigma-70, region 4